MKGREGKRREGKGVKVSWWDVGTPLPPWKLFSFNKELLFCKTAHPKGINEISDCDVQIFSNIFCGLPPSLSTNVER